MIGYFLLFQILAIVAGKASLARTTRDVAENDPNLNPGFDLAAFRQGQLDLHNYYRAKHEVPLMSLDNILTQQAQSFAEQLALMRALVHCSKVPGCSNPMGAGENLAMAYGSTTDVEINATKAWYDEIWDYNFCSNGGQRPDHEGKAIGHFTQVVWKTSTKLGIGYARTSDRKMVYVVGRYLDHGNVVGQYLSNVQRPNYIFQTYQNNCFGINGNLREWLVAGQCSRNCGGGIQFKTRNCTNPKPSLNGRDCVGNTKEIAVREWCNTESCSGTKSHRDEQCEARGYSSDPNNFGGQNDCTLHCYLSGRIYTARGHVDDGTHCNSDSGACVAGECVDMPNYFPPTQAPPSGQITGQYTGTPTGSIWNNIVFTIPNGATFVTITNNNYREAEIVVGYQSSSFMEYNFAEAAWMDRSVNYYGKYETTRSIKGVEFVYKRDKNISTINIEGPVEPTSGYSIVLFVRGTGTADISWNYTA